MKLNLKAIAGVFVLAFCVDAKAQPAGQQVVSFAAPVIDCYTSEQSLDAQRCTMTSFGLPVTVSDASGNFRVRIRDRNNRRWWVREGDVVFRGAVDGLSGAGSAPLQGRGARAALDDRLRAVILAGGEAPRGRDLASALIGSREAALRDALAGTGAGVQRVSATELLITIPVDALFGFEGDAIQPSGVRILAPLAQVLGEEQSTLIDVRGYSDASGVMVNNLAMSERRAQHLAELLTHVGVRRERVITEGYGASNPIASNLTAEGRAQNRRIEISVRVIAAGRD